MTVVIVYSAWHELNTVDAKDCLVVILGIGEYDCNDNDDSDYDLNNLTNIGKDYQIIIETFYKLFGYSIMFMDKTNTLNYCNKKPKKITNHDTDENNYEYTQTKLKKDAKGIKFKLNWTDETIEKFVQNVQQILLTGAHDSLLFFVSSYGESDSLIIDSNGEQISLLLIFSNFFGKYCNIMLNRPKIFFIDIKLTTNQIPHAVESLLTLNMATIGENIAIDTDIDANLHENKTNNNEQTITHMKSLTDFNSSSHVQSILPGIGSKNSNLIGVNGIMNYGNYKDNHQTNSYYKTNASINVRGPSMNRYIERDAGIDENVLIHKNDTDSHNFNHNVNQQDLNLQRAALAQLSNDQSDKNLSRSSFTNSKIFEDHDRTRLSKTGKRRTTLKDLFHNQANCRFIHANSGVGNYDVNGGYLIQAIKHVFEDKSIENRTLDDIINQIRQQLRQMELENKAHVKTFQDVNQMNFHVYFKHNN